MQWQPALLHGSRAKAKTEMHSLRSVHSGPLCIQQTEDMPVSQGPSTVSDMLTSS